MIEFAIEPLVGVGPISRHPLPLRPEAIAWFVRGMSVAAEKRSCGIGGRYWSLQEK